MESIRKTFAILRKDRVFPGILLLTLGSVVCPLAGETYSPLFQEWLDHRGEPGKARLNDYSYAGFQYNERPYPTGEDLPVFDVTKAPYGATVNHAADDDYGAIQHAIQDAEARGGGVVYLPAGVYDVSVREPNSLLILGVTNGKPLIFRGDGPGKTILRMHTNDYTHAFEKNDPKFSALPILSVGAGLEFSGESIDLSVRSPRGTRELTFAKAVPWKKGDILKIRSRNTAYEDPEGKLLGNASLALVAPLRPEPSWGRFGASNSRVSLNLEVADVRGATVVTRTPVPLDIEVRYPGSDLPATAVQLCVSKAGGRQITSWVGVEGIGFEGMYHGSNVHHSCNEADYLWNGLQFNGTVHSWARGLSFRNIVNGVAMSGSLGVTVEDVVFLKGTVRSDVTRYQGHFGANVSGSAFCLYRKLVFEGRYQHYVSFNANVLATVYSDVVNKTMRFNEPNVVEQGLLDSHGWCFPSHMLFENFSNFAVHCGGNGNDMPHAGQDMVFWNIGVGPWLQGSYWTPEFFQFTYANGAAAAKRPGWTKYMGYKLFPRAMIVHPYSVSGKEDMTINQDPGDRESEEVYIQGMNPPAWGSPRSVFDEQLRLRRAGP